MPLLSGFCVPASRFFLILGNTFTLLVHVADVVLGERIGSIVRE